VGLATAAVSSRHGSNDRPAPRHRRIVTPSNILRPNAATIGVVKAVVNCYISAMDSNVVATSAALPSISEQAYRQLRVIARARLRHGGRETLLDTSALVHEAYLRIVGGSAAGGLGAAEQRRFLAYASRTMRSVIVDFARRRQSERHGGDVLIVTLTGALDEHQPAAADDIVRVHEALEQLAAVDARLAQVVEMRYFAGLSEVQIAQALDISERTVRRDWDKARLLLERALAE
jgi:RNA polymerase sigma factor (TIGR02999 family)